MSFIHLHIALKDKEGRIEIHSFNSIYINFHGNVYRVFLKSDITKLGVKVNLDYRSERRIENEVNQNAFKEEKERQTHIISNKQNNVHRNRIL